MGNDAAIPDQKAEYMQRHRGRRTPRSRKCKSLSMDRLNIRKETRVRLTESRESILKTLRLR